MVKRYNPVTGSGNNPRSVGSSGSALEHIPLAPHHIELLRKRVVWAGNNQNTV